MSNDRELLARLGLPEYAGPQEIETAYTDIVAYLEAAPHDLRTWARQQVEATDRSYALLAGSNVDDAEVEPAAAPRARAGRVPRRVVHSAPVPVDVAGRRRVGPMGRLVIAVAAIAGTLVVGYAVYASDIPAVPGLSGTPAPESSAAALDTARVAELMQAIAANPDDVAALQELGDIYFDAGDYGVAAEWETKVLAINPDDVTAHLALGAGQYNLGNSAEAEVQWRAVLALEPQNIEAHYDLGFMYFSADPPDVERTIAEWRQVVEIAPDSAIAQTVSTHLATLEESQASVVPVSSPVSSSAPSAVPSVAP